MNETLDNPKKKFEEITVMFVYTDGNSYTQQVPMKFAHMIEDLLEWYRSDKSKPTWSWNFDAVQRIMLFQKAHIVSIDIDGYIELTRIKHKWYEKLFDKLMTAIVFMRMKGGDTMKKTSSFERKDKAADKKQGVKENSAKDKKMDSKKK